MPARERGSYRMTETDLKRPRAKSGPSSMSSAEYRSIESKNKSESRIQCSLMRTLGEIPYKKGFIADYTYSIPNGGSRSEKTAGIMKAEGVKKGMPDFNLFIARAPYHSLFVEMKTEKGRLSESQEAVISLLRQEGHKVVVCRSEQHAVTEIFKYLGIGL